MLIQKTIENDITSLQFETDIQIENVKKRNKEIDKLKKINEELNAWMLSDEIIDSERVLERIQYFEDLINEKN